MQARICDNCKSVVEGDLPETLPFEVQEKYASLSIKMVPGAELCSACVKKEQYKAAKAAFELLQTKKARKPKTPSAPAEGSSGISNGKPEGKPKGKKA